MGFLLVPTLYRVFKEHYDKESHIGVDKFIIYLLKESAESLE